MKLLIISNQCLDKSTSNGRTLINFLGDFWKRWGFCYQSVDHGEPNQSGTPPDKPGSDQA